MKKKQDYLRSVYENILYRDVASRYKLTNTKSLKDLLYYLISNVGKEFSYNKLKKLIGVKNPTTVKDYIEYFENSYLIYTLNRYDYSLSKQIFSEKKVYCIDTGIANTISFKFSEDRGRLLENLVFIELKRRNHEIYYHKQKKECDFVLKEGLGIVSAIQVTKSLDNPETKQREVSGLLDACKSYGLDSGLILTDDDEEEFVQDGVRVYVKPVWKWLLTES